MKRVSFTLVLAFGALTTFGTAAQIKGFVSGYAPGTVKETMKAKGDESSSDLHSDFTWSLGGEFLAFPTGPLMVGGGLGFFSVQKDGDANVVMPAVPLWASVGVIGPEEWKVRPYLEARVGYPIPASKFKTWWDKPLNFFVGGNLGAQLPYHMGVEFNCSYLTMDKYFKKQDVNFRLSSLKFGGSITVHFDLFKSGANSDSAPVAKQDSVAEPSAEEFSYGYSSSDVNENADAVDSNAGYGESAAEQPAEETAVDSVAGPVAETSAEESPVEQPADEMAETVSEETAENSVENPAADSTAAAPSEEETKTVEEPAPKPEPKPAAKKTSSKKKTTKKASKKSSKKSTKKTTKKKK